MASVLTTRPPQPRPEIAKININLKGALGYLVVMFGETDREVVSSYPGTGHQMDLAQLLAAKIALKHIKKKSCLAFTKKLPKRRLRITHFWSYIILNFVSYKDAIAMSLS